MKIRRQGGFSLLEVLAAMLLLAVAFAALLHVTGSSLALNRHAAERSEAALWARTVLDNAFIDTPIQTGLSQGRLDDRYRWRLRVAHASHAGGQASAAQVNLPQLYRLDLDILWGGDKTPRTLHVSTLRLAPPAARKRG